ncbi:MAG: carbamoyltransferase HypF, partial [Phycisphaerae bacterium]|nr:carbamoyltransferase HypF [Phycisphaerae bacterium]
RHFIDTINHLEALFDARVELIAADMHPQYLSTEYALRRHSGALAGRSAVPLVRVQHHHAHIAACLAENAQAGPAIGLACDGVGYGDDGAVWGCEVLQADIRGYRRLGHLRCMPLVGGDAAATETYRPALAALHDAFGQAAAEYAHGVRTDFPEEKLQAAVELLMLDVNCPPGSSLGRWFDAVAWLCGLAERNSFEGQAPMMLEAAIQNGVGQAYDFRLVAEGPFTIDLRPMVEQIVGDLRNGQDAGMVAAKFHNTVVSFLAASALRAREETNLDVVALSGGCFANRYLTARLSEALAAEGLRVLRHRTIPCNDGGVALGQAVVAAAGAAQRSAAAAGPAADVRARENKAE